MAADEFSTELDMIWLQPQPDFPKSDLTPENAAILGGWIIPREPGVEAYALTLEENQHGLFMLAYNALHLDGYPVPRNPESYKAFCLGFASVEFMRTAVRTDQYDMVTAVRQALRLYVRPGLDADLSLSKRRTPWAEQRPNICRALLEAGRQRGETLAEIESRLIGGQIASELQLRHAA